MPELKNQRHERFSQLVASGIKATPAYREVYGAKGKGAESASCSLARKVSARIEEIAKGYRKHVEELEEKHKAEHKEAVETLIATKDEILQWATQTLRANPEDAAMDNPLCDLRITKMGPVAVFTDKATAAERICKMLGWDAPDKLVVSGAIATTPQAVLEAVLRSPALAGLTIPNGSSNS